MPSRKPPRGPSQGLFSFDPPARAPATLDLAREEREEIVAAKSAPDEPRVFSVGELVRAASRTLEARFPSVWVEGEITNLSRPRSGHIYFSLCEHDAILPSVMFRSAAVRVKLELKEGMHVRVRGRLSIFEAQGKFQLYAEAIEEVGVGALQRAFEELKARLAAEGLFDQAKKRPLPAWPRRIGICTSPTGAVIRDILHVSERRGRVRMLLAPCQVQGPTAAIEIRAALTSLQKIADVDVIIVARGGGAAEDLAAFNDEQLARAIRNCRVPVVSAVGHEVDFTIADFVADLRAPTPSAAAELVVPLFSQLGAELEHIERRLVRAGTRTLADGRQRLDDAVTRSARALHRRIGVDRRALEVESRRLAHLHPRARLSDDRGRLEGLRARLEKATRMKLVERRRSYEAAAGTLSALSPLRVLERGYAIARTTEGHVLTGPESVQPGDEVEVLVSRGVVACRVESTRPLVHGASEPKGK
jgi:exodeoxyribonuclease VII large subunit